MERYKAHTNTPEGVQHSQNLAGDSLASHYRPSHPRSAVGFYEKHPQPDNVLSSSSAGRFDIAPICARLQRTLCCPSDDAYTIWRQIKNGQTCHRWRSSAELAYGFEPYKSLLDALYASAKSKHDEEPPYVASHYTVFPNLNT